MDTFSTKVAQYRFAEILNTAVAGKERVVLTQEGKPVVAVVPIEDLERLEAIEDRLDVEAARAALREAEAEGTTPWEEVKREAGL